jgi:hypothetical protein
LELRRRAGESTKVLKQAERASRFLGYHREKCDANLTNRLLKAAAKNSTLPTSSEAELSLIKQVSEFCVLGRDEQWAYLSRLEPKLRELEKDVRSRGYGELRAREHGELADGPEIRREPAPSPRTSEWGSRDMERLRSVAANNRRLMAHLRRVVGPLSGHGDPVVSSQHAFDVARVYLLHDVRPVPDRE